MAAQRDVVGDTIKRLYTEGDPTLMAFASLLDAKSPDGPDPATPT